MNLENYENPCGFGAESWAEAYLNVNREHFDKIKLIL